MMRRRLQQILTTLAAMAIFSLVLGSEFHCTQTSEARPSLAGLEAEVQANRDAVCAAADANGNSYRPFVCDPRCDCFAAGTPFDSCEEVLPGTFEAGGALQGSCSVDVTPADLCGSSNFCDLPQTICASDADCGSGRVCVAGQFCVVPCTSDAECPVGELCVGGTVCGVPCADSGDCPAQLACSNSSRTPCTDDDDCSGDELCLEDEFGPPGAMACFNTCTAGSECSDPLTLVVGEPDSVEVFGCRVGSGANRSINSNDALECLAQIEASIGQPCTTLP